MWWPVDFSWKENICNLTNDGSDEDNDRKTQGTYFPFNQQTKKLIIESVCFSCFFALSKRHKKHNKNYIFDHPHFGSLVLFSLKSHHYSSRKPNPKCDLFSTDT